MSRPGVKADEDEEFTAAVVTT